VTAGKAFKRFIDGVWITPADGTAVINLLQSTTYPNGVIVYDWLADSEEMRAKPTNEPFEEDLEDRRSDQGVQKSNDGIICVPEGA
jgi:hypothetical protein